jgi:hypothetical protein
MSADRPPTCLAEAADGTRCREPGTVPDPQHGGLVCWRHDPERWRRFCWDEDDITLTQADEADEEDT